MWSFQQDWKISKVKLAMTFLSLQLRSTKIIGWLYPGGEICVTGCHVTSRNQGLSSNDQGRQRRETLGTRLTCDFRLVLSRLFYLYKFSFVVHAKCSSPACCMNYKVKFTEVKQARKVKPEVTCSLIYVITHSKRREDWCEWWTKMTANLNVLKLLKKIAFYPNQFFLSQKFVGWDIESDKKIKILTIWAL